MLLHRTTRGRPWRRPATVLFATTLDTGLLAGRGSASDPADRAGDDRSTARAGAFPVTVEHTFGSTTVEEALERVDLVDVDRIFVIDDEAGTEALKKSGLFADLDAMKKGNVSCLPDSEGPAVGAAISQGTLLSLPYAGDELVESAAGRG